MSKYGPTVKLSEKLIIQARHYGRLSNRSIPEQIEHWANIGNIAEKHPFFSYNFLKTSTDGFESKV